MAKLIMIGLGLAVLLALSSLVNCQSQYCEYNLGEIKNNLNSSGNVNSFTVNCLAARDATHAEAISISVFYIQSGSGDSYGDVRYDFQCVGGTTLVPTPSSNVSYVSNHACTSCDFAIAEPCMKRCEESCGSCEKSNSIKCSSCRYIQRIEHGSNAHDDLDCLNGCLDCAKCNFDRSEQGCECDGYLQPVREGDIQYVLPGEEFTSRCVPTCITPNKPAVRHGRRYCDVCGVPMCVRCGSGDQCRECVAEYSLYTDPEGEHDPECLTEEEHRRRELEHLTSELLHEQEHEEDEREETALLLRILLPIFCILTLLMCVGMSVFTHYWYPYIDEEGKKRSKTKPEEEPEPTVWRPRPTIRLR